MHLSPPHTCPRHTSSGPGPRLPAVASAPSVCTRPLGSRSPRASRRTGTQPLRYLRDGTSVSMGLFRVRGTFSRCVAPPCTEIFDFVGHRIFARPHALRDRGDSQTDPRSRPDGACVPPTEPAGNVWNRQRETVIPPASERCRSFPKVASPCRTRLEWIYPQWPSAPPHLSVLRWSEGQSCCSSECITQPLTGEGPWLPPPVVGLKILLPRQPAWQGLGLPG